MAFGCFAPRPDIYATLPKGVALADPNSALTRRHSTKPSLSIAYRPPSEYLSTPTVNGTSQGLARSATLGGIRQGVKRVVRKALSGFPSQPDDSTQVDPDQTDTVSEEKSVEDLLEASPVSTLSHHPTARSGEKAVNDPIEGESAFGGRPRSPRPNMMPGLSAGPKRVVAKSITSRSTEDGLSTAAHLDGINSSHDGVDNVKKVKRKAAPIYVPSKIIAPTASRTEEGSEDMSVRDLELSIPLDERGRPMHYVGGHYMTNTTKVKWDGTMDEIAKALKMSY